MFDILVFTILIPTLIGLLRFNKIEHSYRFFILMLLASSLNELNFAFNPNENYKHLISHVNGIVESFFMLNLFLCWDKNSRTVNTKIILNSILLVLLSIGIYNIQDHRYTANIIHILILAAVSVYAFDIFNQKTIGQAPSKMAISKVLIIIPYIIYNIYYIITKIILYNLYKPASKHLFIDLYRIIILINLISYFSYSLAILWAPKKEKYL